MQLGIIYNIGDNLQIGRFSSSGGQIFIWENETVMRITVCICAPYNCRLQMEIKKDGDKPAFFDRCTAYLQS